MTINPTLHSVEIAKSSGLQEKRDLTYESCHSQSPQILLSEYKNTQNEPISPPDLK